MSTPLFPAMLEVGLNAVWRLDGTGVAAQITHIALGDAGYKPDQGLPGLRSERARYPIADGDKLSSRQIHVTALADGDAEFWVREVGFILSDGTCLAVWSDPNRVLAYKPAGTDLLLAYDVTLSSVPADSVTVISTGASLSLCMAEEYTALAIAQLGEMQRGLKRGEQDRQHADHLTVVDQRLTDHDRRHASTAGDLQRLDVREQLHRNELTELATAQAAALINLQHITLQQTVLNP